MPYVCLKKDRHENSDSGPPACFKKGGSGTFSGVYRPCILCDIFPLFRKFRTNGVIFECLKGAFRCACACLTRDWRRTSNIGTKTVVPARLFQKRIVTGIEAVMSDYVIASLWRAALPLRFGLGRGN